MEEQVRLFNALPRPKKTPITRKSNHWVFGSCHAELNPPLDFQFVVNPESGSRRSPGKGLFPPHASAFHKAETAVGYLLDAFTDKGGNRRSPLFVPWSWSTLDADTARAVEERLRDNGIRAELCKVGVCSAAERAALEDAREDLMDFLSPPVDRRPAAVEPGDTTKCHGCGMGQDCFFMPLMRCARCGKASYHSSECQKSHWKRHKPICSAPASTSAGASTSAPADASANAPADASASASAGASADVSASASNLSPYDYYWARAFADPHARVLLQLVRLDQSIILPLIHPRARTMK
ncbi:hypothetical protein OQA88_917 [Cercophora sp. LCS_1]